MDNQLQQIPLKHSLVCVLTQNMLLIPDLDHIINKMDGKYENYKHLLFAFIFEIKCSRYTKCKVGCKLDGSALVYTARLYINTKATTILILMGTPDTDTV